MTRTTYDALIIAFRVVVLSSILLIGLSVGAKAQYSSASGSQRAFIKVDKMLDLAFEDKKDKSKGMPSDNLADIVNGATPTHTFSIRTNEHFKLTVSTTDNTTDSLLQVKISEKGKNDTSARFNDISSIPQDVLTGNTESEDHTINVQYRLKPGSTAPPDGLKDVNLMYTASHP